jgi:hypothetical protein
MIHIIAPFFLKNIEKTINKISYFCNKFFKIITYVIMKNFSPQNGSDEN